LTELISEFHLTREQVGWIAGAAFWGPTLSVLVGGQLCDLLGMGRIMKLAFAAHAAGTLLTIGAGGFWSLWIATLSIGIANGLVEAGINPLIATLYPDRKTEKLNVLHAWFPGGIVIGGVIAYLLTLAGLNWQWKMGCIMAPTVVYGAMFLTAQLPATERLQAGISATGMYREIVRPQFLLLVFCMLLTAATELGPNQWIPSILTATAGLPGILVLVWINGIMTIGRLVAGPVVHRLSPVGLLIGAAFLSGVGLLLLSTAASPVSAVLAATVFAVGICYFWPTMLGITSERFPAGGALAMGVIGAAGNLSVALILPLIGRIYDNSGPAIALRSLVVFPILLVALFGAIWLHDRARGGYKIVRLSK
jgi:fucose permease